MVLIWEKREKSQRCFIYSDSSSYQHKNWKEMHYFVNLVKFFSELDMIETIERAKEGYESDVEDDEDLDDIEVLEEEQQVV